MKLILSPKDLFLWREFAKLKKQSSPNADVEPEQVHISLTGLIQFAFILFD